MTSRLTPQDLAELAQAPTAEKRISIAAHIVEVVQEGGLSADESLIAEEILGLMARDAAERVREALAAIVSSLPDIPKDVVLTLAADFEKIAKPVLRNSPLLSDEDLIEIVRQGNVVKQEAIAGRAHVGTAVAETLVEEGAELPVATLMRNPGAAVSPDLMDRAIDRFEHSEIVGASIAERSDLPLSVAERLVSLVSDRLRGFLLARPELSNDLANKVATHSRERATLSLFDSYGRGRNIGVLIRQLSEQGKLTPSLLLRAACVGDFILVEAAFCELTRLEHRDVFTLLHEQGRNGVQSLVSNAGLPQALSDVLSIAVDVYQSIDLDGGEHDRERFRMRMIERVLTRCDSVGADDIEYLLLKADQLAQQAPFQAVS